MNASETGDASASHNADAKFARDTSLTRVRRQRQAWDLLVIGGGATGVGVALDAASRRLRVLLVERSDFGKGTSSRSTKLIHGGVRYLRQGNITLVRDALRERALLRENAPHLVDDLSFIIPCGGRVERFYYSFGLKLYDWLAGGRGFGRSHGIGSGDVHQRLPGLADVAAGGGVVYHDGQFDDTRLLIGMARTAAEQGACLINYVSVTALQKDAQGKITGADLLDHESGDSLAVTARCVINATGPFCDELRQLDDQQNQPLIETSQGVHLTLPRRFFPGDTAMIVPETSDGRVLFIIPWHEHVIVGTTDTSIPEPVAEPKPQSSELAFLLQTASQYLRQSPTLDDVLSIFTGIRPLVRDDTSSRTASLSRDHKIAVSESGLLTITGGKWTTVRKMSEDCVDRAIKLAGLEQRPCETASLKLHGYADGQPTAELPSDWHRVYGSDWQQIEQLQAERPELSQRLHSELPYLGAEIVWAVRSEMARQLEDVLARRMRALFLNAQAAIEMAPQVAQLMAEELGEGQAWQTEQLETFGEVARHFSPQSYL